MLQVPLLILKHVINRITRHKLQEWTRCWKLPNQAGLDKAATAIRVTSGKALYLPCPAYS